MKVAGVAVLVAGTLVLIGLSPPPPAHAQQLEAGAGAVVAGTLRGCSTDLVVLNHVAGWQVAWPGELESAPVGDAEERRAMLARWEAAPALLREDARSLRRGLERGRGVPKPVVRRVVDQLDALLDAEPNSSVFESPGRRSASPRFRSTWMERVAAPLREAVADYAAFLRLEYLPAAPSAPGLGTLSGREGCYARALERWTTVDVPVAEMEELGRARMAEVEAELARAAGIGREELPALLDSLRRGAFSDTFRSGEEVVEHARRALRRARAGLSGAFGTLPSTPVVVAPISAPGLPAGFYRPPPGPDGSGRYMVNTTRPRDRRLMSEVIAFHEGLPGHHLLYGLVAEGRVPDGGFNAGFVEGWAVYAERLADELGFYGSGLDRTGYLAKQLWTAARLVVEPGLHQHGWSRERAISFMLDHTALSRDEVESEVDRYTALPGQAPAYMLGALQILRLREEAREALGADFDPRAFHDLVLGGGVRSLSAVEADVRDWISAAAPVELRDPGS